MFDIGFPRDWSSLKKLIWLKAAISGGGASAVWKTVTGTLIHLTDALASPMQKCEVTLEPIQAGSGDPSPTNVRPITGWTGCEVKRTGANLVKPFNELTHYSHPQAGNGTQKTMLADGVLIEVTAYTGDAYYSANTYPFISTSTENSITFNYDSLNNAFSIGICVEVPSNATLYYGFTSTRTGANSYDIHYYDADKYYIGRAEKYKSSDQYGSITTPANAKYAVFAFRRDIPPADTTISNFWVSFSDSDYTQYAGRTTLSVTFPDGLINQWDEECETGILNSDGTVSPTTGRLVTNYIPIKAGEKYCVVIPYNGRGRGAFYDINKTLISYYGDFPTSGYDSVFPNYGTIYGSGKSCYFTFVAPENACYLRYNIIAAYGATYNNDISFNYPSTVSYYHPYHDDIVYGCTLDFVSGDLAITWGGADLSNLHGGGTSAATGYSRWYFVVPNCPRGFTRSNIWCSHVATAYNGGDRAGESICSEQEGYLYFSLSLERLGEMTIKEYIDEQHDNGTPVYAAWKLVEPIHIQLTPQQISTLKGENNVWGSGNIEMTYKAQAE